MSTVAMAIAVLVGAGILIWATISIANTISDSSDREICRDSVLLRERSKVLEHPVLGELKCKTENVQIDSTDEDEINRIFAEEMYDCWYQFGEGEKDFLSDYNFAGGDNWCFVCSTIDFSEKTKDSISVVDDLDDYLASERVPFAGEVTFFEYFFGEGSYLEDGSSFLDIDTSDKKYVVFFADKRMDKGWLLNPTKIEASDWVLMGTGCSIGGGVGAVVGSIIPGAGTVAGAAIGCGIGTIIVNIAEIATKRTDYVSGLYIGSSEEAANVCNTAEVGG